MYKGKQDLEGNFAKLQTRIQNNPDKRDLAIGMFLQMIGVDIVMKLVDPVEAYKYVIEKFESASIPFQNNDPRMVELLEETLQDSIYECCINTQFKVLLHISKL